MSVADLITIVALVAALIFEMLTGQRERTRHAAEVARLTLMYERMLTATRESNARLLDQFEAATRLALTGSSTVQAPVMENREPDAHAIASRVVQEQTIERAVNWLREEYRKLGHQFSDDDLREEAVLLLSTGDPQRFMPKEPEITSVPEAAR